MILYTQLGTTSVLHVSVIFIISFVQRMQSYAFTANNAFVIVALSFVQSVWSYVFATNNDFAAVAGLVHAHSG